ncbi:hypothetical protein NIES21_15210 [Anabaenopsis circularis NIES-21]|uniref:Uncharacterized protein n=1 Tax=Anabaenopsis circularis NIES-21 TaxID=1085406 RepID=A0A1Z4GDY0_9CYAN|nr:hypothetical protein NIES21_15210 [Anabaenopsis circularis NIES-21]
MGKRFNNLEAALRYLQGTGTDTTTIPTAPAGSQLAEYQEWRARKRVVDYTRDAASKPGTLEEAVIKPFGLPTADAKEFLVDFSKRAKDKLTDTGVDVAALNHVASPTDAQRVIGFTPAKAIVTIYATGDGTPTPSKITGRKYNKKNNNSYTLPFGRGTDDPSYSQAKSTIVTAVSNGSTSRGVSFQPEIYR